LIIEEERGKAGREKIGIEEREEELEGGDEG
jgi:hypothetical protein